MENTKKKSNYGFLFAILKILLGIVIVVVLILGGLYLYIRFALGLDIFGAIRSVKKLNNDFAIESVVDSPYETTDVDSAFAQFDNAGLQGFYTKDSEGNYTINDDISGLPMATCDIKLSDKQLAGFMQTFVVSSLKLDGEDIEDLQFEIKQAKFSNYRESGTGTIIDANIVLYTSISSLKDSMNVFPFTLITKYIPDDLYISADFSIQKTGTRTFSVEAISLKLNGLTADETATIMGILGKIADIGDSYELSAELGNTIMQALVCGKNGEAGLVTELSSVNIEDFNFEKDENEIYFVFKVKV